jgi:uncharacterized repeat protein (TIGR04052 family)
MKRMTILLLSSFALLAQAQTQPVEIRFRATVGNEDLACGRSYANVGTSKSTITPRDFRFYVHQVRLIDAAGRETPLQLKQDDKWQLDDVALLDFENATGACGNGNPDLNTVVAGTVPAGDYRGLRFVLGVPFEKNHTDPLTQPSPLNLTAMAWSWNGGRKFARLDFSSTGAPRGYAIHLGSTGCVPDETSNTVPAKCSAPNRVGVYLPEFVPAKDVVVADLGALLADSNVDEAGKMMSGCMSGPETPACGPLFLHLGLPFPNQGMRKQDFFRAQRSAQVSGATRAER